MNAVVVIPCEIQHNCHVTRDDRIAITVILIVAFAMFVLLLIEFLR